MKTTSFIFLFFYLTFQCTAQHVKNFIDSKIMGGSEREEISRTWKLPNNDYLIFGYSQSEFLEDSTATFYADEQTGDGACFLYCLGSNGNIKWKRIIGGTDFDQIIDIKTNANEIICFGVTESDDRDLQINKGGFDCWIFKIDYNGNKLMSKSFGSSGYDILDAIHIVNDSTYLAYIYVDTLDEDFAKKGFLEGKNLVKFDSSFTTIEHVRYLGSSETLFPQKSMFNKNGNLLTTSFIKGNGSLVAEMYKPNGDLIYRYIEYSDTSDINIYQENSIGSFAFLEDTVILPISKGYFPGGGSFDKGKLEIIKLAPNGNVIKKFTYPLLTAITSDYINVIDDEIFAGGWYINFTDSSWSLPSENIKGYMLSFDKNLNPINTFSLDGNDKQFNKTYLNYVDFDFNLLEYKLIGSSSSFDIFKDAQPVGKEDLFFAKYKAYPLGLESITNKYNGISVFPNPFNNSLQLSAGPNEVNYVEIMDLQGRMLLKSFSNKIETSNLVSGQYILKLHLKDYNIYQYKIIKE